MTEKFHIYDDDSSEDIVHRLQLFLSEMGIRMQKVDQKCNYCVFEFTKMPPFGRSGEGGE